MSASITTRSLRLARTAAIAAVATLGAVGTARAQPAAAQAPVVTNLFDQGHWTVTPFIGVGFSGDLDSPTFGFGAAGGYVWSSRVALEGAFSVVPSGELSGFVEVENKVWSVTGDILYHFPGRDFVPYGVFGIGVGHGTVDVNPNDPLYLNRATSSTQFVLNFGGGAEKKIRDRVAFRGDLRYFFGGDLVPDYWRLSTGLTFDLGHF